MATLLTMRAEAERLALPIEAAAIRPDTIAGRSRREIEGLPIVAGNRTERLGDLFEVRGDGVEEVEIEGDLARVALLGAGMGRGSLVVRGPVGPRAGSRMSGGRLALGSDAGPLAGEGMTGGLLRIRGTAGDHLAAPLPGHPCGMDGGVILVEGNTGAMAAMRMRRGTIAIAGDAGPGAGCAMLAGSLFVFGRLGAGAGALMDRGTIVAFRPHPVLAVFLDTGAFRQPFLNLYFDGLEAAGFALPREARGGRYRRRVGDISGPGKGEILTLEGT